MEKSLQQHINDDRDELSSPNISGQRRRHLEDEIDALEAYQANRPCIDPLPYLPDFYNWVLRLELLALHFHLLIVPIVL